MPPLISKSKRRQGRKAAVACVVTRCESGGWGDVPFVIMIVIPKRAGARKPTVAVALWATDRASQRRGYTCDITCRIS